MQKEVQHFLILLDAVCNIMMNWFLEWLNEKSALNLIFSQDHYWRLSSLQPYMLEIGFEPEKNVISDSVK